MKLVVWMLLFLHLSIDIRVYAQKKGSGGSSGSSGGSSGGNSGGIGGNSNTNVGIGNNGNSEGFEDVNADNAPGDVLILPPLDQQDIPAVDTPAVSPNVDQIDTPTRLQDGRPTRCTFSSPTALDCSAPTVPTSTCSSSNNLCSGREVCDDCSGKCEEFDKRCGDGVCVPGEDCFNCPADCTGFTSKFDSDTYCCGSDVTGCGDARCTLFGQRCVELCDRKNVASSAGVSIYENVSKMITFGIGLPTSIMVAYGVC